MSLGKLKCCSCYFHIDKTSKYKTFQMYSGFPLRRRQIPAKVAIRATMTSQAASSHTFFLPLAVFSIAKHLLFREHNAVIRKLARQRNDVGCFPEEKKWLVPLVNNKQ